MKSIEEHKEDYAKDNGYKNWDDFMWCIKYAFKDKNQAITLLESSNNEIAERYMKQAVNASLEEAKKEIERNASPINDVVHVHKLVLTSKINSLKR